MPLAPPPRRRLARPARRPAGALRVLHLRRLPQPPPHDVGVDEPGLGRVLRPVRAAVRDGGVDRLENPVVAAAEYQTHEHDVLVIGAGGAGLRAAIEASAAGVRVGVVCKSLLGKAHTVMAEGGIAAALANVDDRDSWRVHFADTMRGGQYVNNWRMAQLHAQEAPARVRELEAWGALFDRTPDGRILQRNFGGHAYPRLVHVGDRTGLEMIRTLQDHGVHQGIDVHMECTVIRLLKDGERIAGALAYERERGRFRLFRAGAVILATGGVGRAYRITSNSWEYTGDGHALAYAAGADLIDMEFLQFHPTGMVWPPSVQGILVTEAVRGEGGVLRNKDGRRFMFADIPPLYKNQTADNEDEGWRYTQGDKSARRPPELLTRDHVARCIVRETKEGRGSPHGGVFLDIAWIREKLPRAEAHIKNKLPGMYHQFKQLAGVDITKEPMEVGPTTHYMMGGVRVDAETQMSTVPGLFAAGECAAGLHGANRLGGNSLSDLLVFGQRAGEFAAQFAKQHRAGMVDREEVDAAARAALAPFERRADQDGGGGPFQLQAELQDFMQDLVGIVRREEEMRRALDRIVDLKRRAARTTVVGNREYNPGWHTALDLDCLLTVSEAITRAALDRKESRGAHFRDDYPKKDDAAGRVTTVIRKGSGGDMQVAREPLPEPPAELTAIIEELK
ncbi:MAG: fumarate reductase/succinate dehydrogenase flavoprotein subunit [Gemmatimonadetes bacterium]|nr:MAG: fumarate reductase/succinate dehydrogenase flavoprotein subunit [Gemmatimonadota bacterium]